MTFCSALASSRRDGFAIAALIRYKMGFMGCVLGGLLASTGDLFGLKWISESKGSQNQKDNVNVTLFYLYDCIAFDVDWPRHNTGNG
jgi:hypothetical protein